MLEENLQQKYVAQGPEDVARFVGKKQKLVVLENALDEIPFGYVQVTMMYKGERHIVLIPEKAKYFMANPGEDGDPVDALDELADFYEECKDFEGELLFKGEFSVTQTNVSMLARNSYGVWAINKLVKQKQGGEEPEWNGEELERLGVNDKYIDERLRGIAAIMLGKDVKEVRAAGLEDVLVHKNVKGTFKEVLTEKEFEEVTCWAGSHYELKEKYKGKGYEIEHRHDTGHKKGWKVFDEKEFVHLPAIEKLESEIQERQKQLGKEATRHDSALLRTYANLKYIAKEDPAKQLDVME